MFAHCFTCNKNLTAVRTIGKTLTAKNIAVLRFDFTGLGESEGDFMQTNFSSNIEDLYSAAEFLKENYQAPSLLIGHSLGGAAVIYASLKIPSIKAIATIGAPSNPKHVSHLFHSSIDEINETGSALVSIGGREFTIQKQFIEDIQENNIKHTLNNFRNSILILHSPQDTTVGIDNAAEIYSAARHPKSFVSLNGADHLLSDKRDSKYVGNIIATWADRYL
ncbi:alpha/beta hydrolase family protein [Lutibacter sp. A80]|uniref:alpha/beta hydrolase family protein n=1 Tax=Lutibacter sp. A80 TaxID=2918453 RepID=UPI00353005B1